MTILLAVINIYLSCSQTTEELLLLKDNCCNSGNRDNDITLSDAKGGIVNMLFVTYKVFISSQDYHSCVFTPSCSEYAVESVTRLGFIRGIFDSADRLTRCHGLRSGDYQFDPATNKLIDPVKNIRYEDP